MTATDQRPVEPVTFQPFPIRFRTVEAIRVARLTPTLLRLTVGGPAAEGFQSGVFDEHVKLVFADPSTGELRLPTPDGDHLDWPRPFPVTREYTVSAHRPAEREIDLDLVVHRGGLASDWAEGLRPGDPVHVAGPPGGYLASRDYGFFLLAGDESALPAIARWLAEAPRDAVGRVVVAVPSAASELPLDGPHGVRVDWLHGPTDAAFVAAVRDTAMPPGATTFVWLAGEAGVVKPLRRWVRHELGLGKEHSSITGYWKRGQADTHEHLDEDDVDEPGDDEAGDDEGH